MTPEELNRLAQARTEYDAGSISAWDKPTPVLSGIFDLLKDISGYSASDRLWQSTAGENAPWRSVMTRPNTPLEWGDYAAGIGANTIETGLGAIDMAGATPAYLKLMKTLGEAGVIAADVPQGVLQSIRKSMAAENVARGGMTNDILDRVTRGTWYHGRSTYPETGESFSAARQHSRNTGEPTGISLTADKSLLDAQFAEHSDESFAAIPGPTNFETQQLKNHPEWAKVQRDLEKNTDELITSRAEIQDIQKEVMELTQNQHLVRPEHQESVRARIFDLSAKRNQSEIRRRELFLEDKKLQDSWTDIKKKISNRHFQASRPPFARVFPKFKGQPTQKILKGWKSADTVKDQVVLKEAWEYAIDQVSRPDMDIIAQYGPGIKELTAAKTEKFLEYDIADNKISQMLDEIGPTFGDDPLVFFNPLEKKQFLRIQKERDTAWNDANKLRTVIDNTITNPGSVAESLNLKQIASEQSTLFNRYLTERLQEKGYSGILYSPERYREYELKMFNPDDVTMLDMRSQDDPALTRMFTNTRQAGAVSDYRTKAPLSSATGLSTEAKQRRLFKAGAGSQYRRLRDWSTETKAAPSSLRDIYQDIDLPGLSKKLMSRSRLRRTKKKKLKK